MYVCVCISARVCVFMYVCMYVCMSMYVYVCMYVCMYALDFGLSKEGSGSFILTHAQDRYERKNIIKRMDEDDKRNWATYVCQTYNRDPQGTVSDIQQLELWKEKE